MKDILLLGSQGSVGNILSEYHKNMICVKNSKHIDIMKSPKRIEKLVEKHNIKVIINVVDKKAHINKDDDHKISDVINETIITHNNIVNIAQKYNIGLITISGIYQAFLDFNDLNSMSNAALLDYYREMITVMYDYGIVLRITQFTDEELGFYTKSENIAKFIYYLARYFALNMKNFDLQDLDDTEDAVEITKRILMNSQKEVQILDFDSFVVDNKIIEYGFFDSTKSTNGISETQILYIKEKYDKLQEIMTTINTYLNNTKI